jgi:hypothetical protein
MYAAIFGMFSLVWFGWAQENPPKQWRLAIGLASAAALLVCLVGVYFSVIHWEDGSVLSDTGTYRLYLVFVGIEFLLAGIGACFLIKRKKRNLIAPWIAFVVGVHFFWLKDIFQDASLNVLGMLLIGIAGLSLWLSKKWSMANSTLTGIGAGTVLFGYAILGLVRYFAA